MNPGRRMAQVNHLLQEQVGRLLVEKAADPRLKMFTVTDVRASRDLNHARVYVTYLGKKEEVETAMENLRRAAGYLRKELGQHIHLKRTPALEFHYDQSVERTTRVLHALLEIENSGELDVEEAEPGESAADVESDGNEDE